MPARNHPRRLTSREVPTSPAEPRDMPVFVCPGAEMSAGALEMTARAWPGAVGALEMASRACLGAAAALEMVARACPVAAECSKWPLEPTPEPQNARRVPLESALEPQHARKVPLEPTAVRCVRFLRSKWPLEKCCLVFFYSRHQLLLGSTLLVHVMHGFTLV